MSVKAMESALEALTELMAPINDGKENCYDWDRRDVRDWNNTIAALRKAIAETKQAEPVAFDDWPEYHYEGMGCGLEDRGITDRYEAMRYGWQEALDRVAEMLDSLGPLYSHPQRRELEKAEPTAWLDKEINCAYMPEELDEGVTDALIPLYAHPPQFSLAEVNRKRVAVRDSLDRIINAAQDLGRSDALNQLRRVYTVRDAYFDTNARDVIRKYTGEILNLLTPPNS